MKKNVIVLSLLFVSSSPVIGMDMPPIGDASARPALQFTVPTWVQQPTKKSTAAELTLIQVRAHLKKTLYEAMDFLHTEAQKEEDPKARIALLDTALSLHDRAEIKAFERRYNLKKTKKKSKSQGAL